MTCTISDISSLFAEIYKINSSQRKEANESATSFNIFKVLRLESDEVGLHSRFIGELLNPNGMHEQGFLFLKLFVHTLNTKTHPLEYNDEELASAIVIIEEHVGNVAEDYTRGGRIDIVVRFQTQSPIVIENKIYAGDQPKQLWRYKQEYPDCNLIYLTLHGYQPSTDSLYKIPITDVHCIAYEHQIVKWLNQCAEKSRNKPSLFETLNQYIKLLKDMTDNSLSSTESETMDLVFKCKENLSAAFQLIHLEDNIKQKTVAMWAAEIKKISEGFGLTVEYDAQEIGHDGTEIKMYKPGSDIIASLYFEGSYYYLIAGAYISGVEGVISDEQREKYSDMVSRIRNRKTLKNYKSWIWVTAVDEFNNLEWEEVLEPGAINKFKSLIQSISKAFFS